MSLTSDSEQPADAEDQIGAQKTQEDQAAQAQLPPEAQGEANGGPLGCCLGVMVGLLLSISIALVSRFYADPLSGVLGFGLSTVVRIVMGIVAFICVIICGRFGWRLGKRMYREYEPPVIPRPRRTPSSARVRQR